MSVLAPVPQQLRQLVTACSQLGGTDTNVAQVHTVCRISPPRAGEPSVAWPDGRSVALRDPGSAVDAPAEQALRVYPVGTAFADNGADAAADGATHGTRSIALAASSALLDGFNATILSVGVAGTGKTEFLFGAGAAGELAECGVVGAVVDALFAYCEAQPTAARCRIGLSCWEVRGEAVLDLLASNHHEPPPAADRHRFVCVRAATRGVTLALLRLAWQRSANWTEGAQPVPLPGSAQYFVRVMLHDTARDFVSVLHVVDMVGLGACRDGARSGANASHSAHKQAARRQMLAFGKLVADLALASAPGAQARPAAAVVARDSVVVQYLAPLLAGNSRAQLIASISADPARYVDSLHALRICTRASGISAACARLRGVTEEALPMAAPASVLPPQEADAALRLPPALVTEVGTLRIRAAIAAPSEQALTRASSGEWGSSASVSIAAAGAFGTPSHAAAAGAAVSAHSPVLHDGVSHGASDAAPARSPALPVSMSPAREARVAHHTWRLRREIKHMLSTLLDTDTDRQPPGATDEEATEAASADGAAIGTAPAASPGRRASAFSPRGAATLARRRARAAQALQQLEAGAPEAPVPSRGHAAWDAAEAVLLARGRSALEAVAAQPHLYTPLSPHHAAAQLGEGVLQARSDGVRSSRDSRAPSSPESEASGRHTPGPLHAAHGCGDSSDGTTSEKSDYGGGELSRDSTVSCPGDRTSNTERNGDDHCGDTEMDDGAGIALSFASALLLHPASSPAATVASAAAAAALAARAQPAQPTLRPLAHDIARLSVPELSEQEALLSVLQVLPCCCRRTCSLADGRSSPLAGRRAAEASAGTPAGSDAARAAGAHRDAAGGGVLRGEREAQAGSVC